MGSHGWGSTKRKRNRYIRTRIALLDHNLLFIYLSTFFVSVNERKLYYFDENARDSEHENLMLWWKMTDRVREICEVIFTSSDLF